MNHLAVIGSLLLFILAPTAFAVSNSSVSDAERRQIEQVNLTSEPSPEELRLQELEESIKFQGFPSVNRFEFETPVLSVAEAKEMLTGYEHLDPNSIIPDVILEQAVQYFHVNKDKIKNKNYMTILDFTKHSGKKRFYLIDMRTGAVESQPVAHGNKSDPDDDGYATIFSNTVNSLMSSVGFALTAETYQGRNGYSLRLDGLQETNSKLRERAVVVHKSSYVSTSRTKQGRSYGCPALPVDASERIIDKIKGGSLIYQWYNL